MTNDLAARIFAHKDGRGSSFCKRYNIKRLVWYETCDMVTNAIQRETTMKHWLRAWKVAGIEKDNPNWDDLYETLG